MLSLLKRLGQKKVTVVVTFPAGDSSNGLTGAKVVEAAGQFFKVENNSVRSQFSTLGGNGNNRGARKKSEELILVLRPK